MRVYITGFMGAGKSTVGGLLAEALDCPFVDLDAAIETAAGESVVAIFERWGEERFRSLEREGLRATERLGSCVVATGGGTPVAEDNRRWMRMHGTVVWLDVPFEQLAARLEDAVRRPLWSSEEEARRLFYGRLEAYRECDHAIPAGGRSAVEVSREIAAILGAPGPG